jgi:hypothetical protein
VAGTIPSEGDGHIQPAMHQRHHHLIYLFPSYSGLIQTEEMLPYARQNESAQRSGTDWNICHGFFHPLEGFSIETFHLRQLFLQFKLFQLPRRKPVGSLKETCITRLKYFGLSSAEQWSQRLDRKFTEMESAAFC